MKTKNTILILATVLSLVTGFISCSKNDPYKVGTHVAAKWSDGNYWGATITEISGSNYKVKYDDNTTKEVTAADLKKICDKADVKTGDKVLAVWSTNGRMYAGTVQEIQAAGAMVKWDDGSSPTLVSFSNITK